MNMTNNLSVGVSEARAFCVMAARLLLCCCGVFLVLPVGAVAANDQRDDIAGSGKKETHHLQGQCARNNAILSSLRAPRGPFPWQALASLLGMHSRAGVSGQMNSIPVGCWTIYTNTRQIVCTQ